MPYLKERLIDFIRDKPRHFQQPLRSGDLYMDVHILGPLPIYDLVGAILYVAGYSLQTGSGLGVQLPLNAPWLDRQWVEYETEYGRAPVVEIPATARQLWAADYGEEAAYTLPFYDTSSRSDGQRVMTHYWDEGNLPSAHIVEFLRGDYPYTLNFEDSPSVKPKWQR